MNTMSKTTKLTKIASMLLLCGGLGMSVANAELVATPLRGDSRLVQFQFDEDNTFLVLAKPRAVTHIQFAADEEIQTVAAGDTQSWELTPTKNRKNLFIKPKFDDTTTSLTVLTDKRNYQFVLQSTAEGKKWYQRVSWLYSNDSLMELEGAAVDNAKGASPKIMPPMLTSGATTGAGPISQPPMFQPTMSVQRGCGSSGPGIRPESMKFNYSIEGDAPFKPRMVFNDGKFTYLQMPADLQELPALFGVIDGAEFSLVNYTVECDYLVAQRVLDAGVLKLGRSEVKFTMNKPKRGLFGFSGN